MDGKRGIRSHILTLAAAAICCLTGCSDSETISRTDVRINFSCGRILTRAESPDENMISDISLMIFDANGSAEECIRMEGGIAECSTRLISGKKYILCACANFGYRIYADEIEELDEITLHLAYPDDYRHGIPMYVRKEIVVGEDGGTIDLELERLMAKISLQMDRRKLSEGVDMNVRSVQIGNCPRKAVISKDNKVSDEDDCFPSGFYLGSSEAEALNRTSESGLSRPVSLYMLENMQGTIDIDEDSDKTFGPNDHRSHVCSYIEINMDYTSSDYESGSEGLIYRFYLGGGQDDLNIERNCHYHITVTPEDDGLSDDGWRVDKSDLTYTGPTYIKGHPADYIAGDIGDKIHIWCELLPETAPFDVGESYMKDDRAEGIYDYEIDEDGHGATLTLTGPGRGLIYMEAGDPINDAALFIIEVNLP